MGDVQYVEEKKPYMRGWRVFQLIEWRNRYEKSWKKCTYYKSESREYILIYRIVTDKDLVIKIKTEYPFFKDIPNETLIKTIESLRDKGYIKF